MSTSTTWDQIEARAAAEAAAEAARHTPKAAAIRCLYQLGSYLAELRGADRAAVLVLLAEEIRPLIADLAASR